MSRWDRRVAMVTGVVVILGGLGLTAIRFVGGHPLSRNAESFAAALALGSIVAAPGVLAIVGARTGRPVLLVPAAIVLVPLSFISFALVTLPLLIPAVLLLVACSRSLAERDTLQSVAAGALAIVGVVGALFTYLAGGVERSFSDGSTTYSTTGWVPWSTTFLTVALVTLAVAAATMTAPRHEGGRDGGKAGRSW